ncbi:Sphingomyelinase D [Metarhizium anisopliae]|nr:Sphingomyelinase D [Metarhizium anisopliae]
MTAISQLLSSLFFFSAVLGWPFSIQARSIERAASGDHVEKEKILQQTFHSPRPFFAIAHRVLMDYGVRDALNHGANALEIDMTAWSKQWYADHDGTLTSRGHTAEHMFRAIAQERRAGKPAIFVWLDLKNPDYCDNRYPACNIEALRNLARDILQPAGVKVLYGFYSSQTSKRAYQVISRGLNSNEAIGIDGNVGDANQVFNSQGPASIKHRVYSKGLFDPAWNFGNCKSSGNQICPQLREGAESRNFGKVFGWTIAENNRKQADQLMSVGVDGLIYGFVATHYYDHPDTRAARKIIADWLSKNKDKAYLATLRDQPW